MKSQRIYERAFFTSLQELVHSLPRLAPSHMRKETVAQAHLLALDVVDHFEKLQEKDNEIRRQVQDVYRGI
jgi:hypothetical protein